MNAQGTLFDDEPSGAPSERAPLSTRMRPRTFDEVVGSSALADPNHAIRQSIERGFIPSLILWGPPGTGKTTLARVIASTAKADMEELSATAVGVAEIRSVTSRAKERKRHNRETILFLDEIHRFNKAQQDVILPFVESGMLHLIGATTENPTHSVNNALRSRTRAVAVHALTPDDLGILLDRALSDGERGLGSLQLTCSNDARTLLTHEVGGDARVLLNALELAANAAGQGGTITRESVFDALDSPHLLYDKAGDQHYWVISAFIKSLRGSDENAALYWLSRMIEAGEDPLFITRRMIVLAAEDIGLANPMALTTAVSCHQALQHVGMPEGYLPLAECAIALALSPKSNAVIAAFGRARADVLAAPELEVPLHLRNAVSSFDSANDFGAGYVYPHSAPDAAQQQEYRPRELADNVYYTGPGAKKTSKGEGFAENASG